MPHPPSAPPPANGGAVADPETLIPSSKRQRRPSVRLGDIGEQPAALPVDPYLPRTKHSKPSRSSDHPLKPHKLPRPPSGSVPPSDRALVPVDDALEPLALVIKRGSRGSKSRPAAGGRRIRSGWAAKADEEIEGAVLKSSGGEDEERCREDSRSPVDKGPVRVVVPEDDDPVMADAAEGDAPAQTAGGEWKNNNSNDKTRSFDDDDGEGRVRSWLDRLGLGRYMPVFEIHDVDDEVLPLLTMEDLKDMGINAVGSRRKIYGAIQKLRKALHESSGGKCSSEFGS